VRGEYTFRTSVLYSDQDTGQFYAIRRWKYNDTDIRQDIYITDGWNINQVLD